MKKIIIHLSDIHFRINWDEEIGIILKSFFTDLEKQISAMNTNDIFMVISGDIVQAGSDSKLYEEFMKQFGSKLDQLGICKNNRICVPGNHDISTDFVKSNFVEHEGIIKQDLNEKSFNEYVANCPKTLYSKFENYLLFEANFGKSIFSDSNLAGNGITLDHDIGIFCLNTALCSSGGFKEISDKGRLLIATRELHKWLNTCNYKIKILVMHHPVNWLKEWAQTELNKLILDKFNLCLLGHNHDQSIYHTVVPNSSLVECLAPQLFSSKKDNLGYSLITIDDTGIDHITYRQWSGKGNFVTGVNFSNTDDGKVFFKKDETCQKKDAGTPENTQDYIDRILTKRFNDSLQSFSSQPVVWIEPVLSRDGVLIKCTSGDSDTIITASTLVGNQKSYIVKAPPQFGLTCLSHYLVKETWKTQSLYWQYVDSKSIKWHSVCKTIKKETEVLGLEMADIKCIILDSWSNIEKDSYKIINEIIRTYKDIPLIVMQTIDDTRILCEFINEPVDRKFETLHLLALNRGNVRRVVAEYNNQRHIGDEDTVLTKVVSDLDALNLHRTPLNCLTLLKVFEVEFDESPVNRTEMVKRILFLLFNMDNIPTYKERPDLKDCEYVLGRFCENMVRNSTYTFERDYFINTIVGYCKERVIDLEVEIVFDILFCNNIIIQRDGCYCFRFSYWIYYFAAHRMHQDKVFADFIFDNMRYAAYPEIIEFYTGIDRSRADALQILSRDMANILTTVKNKCGLPDEMDPYKLAQWKPTKEGLSFLQKEISDNVINSNLPEIVKDQYADQHYNPEKPYHQTIRDIFIDYSLLMLMQTTKATSRALRNSDYVDPSLKHKLLNEILCSWEQMTNVLVSLTPILASDGQAAYDGVTFTLSGKFNNESMETRCSEILNCLPANIERWFGNDLFSRKMGPLLFSQLENTNKLICKHELILHIISHRPRNWKVHVQNYIVSIHKNSFYLLDVLIKLRSEYLYGFMDPQTNREIVYLIKMVLAKHDLGNNNPGKDTIKKISDDVLPKRVTNTNIGD